jgi:hypothetical protein
MICDNLLQRGRPGDPHDLIMAGLRGNPAGALSGGCHAESERKFPVCSATTADDERVALRLPLINSGSIPGHRRLRGLRKPNQSVAAERPGGEQSGRQSSFRVSIQPER